MDDDKQHKIFHIQCSKTDQGVISEKFETGQNGPLTVSPGTIGHGKPDPGGVSYGIYQFTSQDVDRHGKIVHNGGTVERFLDSADGKPWRDHFKDEQGKKLTPGSKAFSNAWTSVKNTAEFAEAQQTFTGKTYYNPQADQLAATGVDLEHRSATLQNVVWSTAVQHGANNPLMSDAISAKAENLHIPVTKLSDRQCIDAIYDARAARHPDTAARYREEKSYAHSLLKQELELQHEHLQGATQSGGSTMVAVPPIVSSELVNRAGEATLATAALGGELAPVPAEILQGAGADLNLQGAQQQRPQQDISGSQDHVKKHHDDPVANYNPALTPRGGGLA